MHTNIHKCIQIYINAYVYFVNTYVYFVNTDKKKKTDTTQVGSAAWQREPGRYIVSSLEGGLVSSLEV